MIEKFLIWTYRNEYKELWVKKCQWIYLIVGFAIYLPLSANIAIEFIPKTALTNIIYWTSLFFINLNSIYLITDVYYGRKILKKYYNKLITYDKVVCCWNDKGLEKGKIYEIESDIYFQFKRLKNSNFYLGHLNHRIVKLVSLKEQRRLKLEKIGQ